MKSIKIKKHFVIVLGVMLFTSSCSMNKQRKATAVEIAKTQFALSHFSKENVPFDSVYSKNDTVLFFKKGSYVGMSVISNQ